MSLRLAPALLISLTAIGMPRASAGGDQVPAARRAMIMGRMLDYDGNLNARAGDTVVLAIVFKAGNGASESEAGEMLSAFKALEQVKVARLPFRVIRIAFGGASDLEHKVAELGVDSLYVCAGLEGEFDRVADVSRRKKLLTLTSQAASVRSGLSVAVYSKDDKASILLNLPASKAEGAAFGGDVLRLAEVIR